MALRMALPSSGNVCQHEGLRLFTILLITRVHIGGHAASALLDARTGPWSTRLRGARKKPTPFTKHAGTHRTGRDRKDRVAGISSVSAHVGSAHKKLPARNRARAKSPVRVAGKAKNY